MIWGVKDNNKDLVVFGKEFDGMHIELVDIESGRGLFKGIVELGDKIIKIRQLDNFKSRYKVMYKVGFRGFMDRGGIITKGKAKITNLGEVYWEFGSIEIESRGNERKEPRYNISVKCNYVRGNNYVETFTKDISLSGACIETEHLLAVGTKLRVHIKGITGAYINTEVCRITILGFGRYEVGLRFLDISLQDKHKLSRYIQNRR